MLVKKLKLGLVLFVISVITAQALNTGNVLAVSLSGTGYFTGGAGNIPDLLWCENDILPGRYDADGDGNCDDGRAIPSTVDTKQEFIDNIVNRWYSGVAREQLGSAFVVNTAIGAGNPGNPAKQRILDATIINEFISRVNNPAVCMQTVNWGAAVGSYYFPNIGDAAFSAHSVPVRGKIRLYNCSSGTTYYLLDYFCGNPAGDFGGLPPYNPIPARDPSYSASTTVGNFYEKGGSAVTFVHTITVNQYPCDPLQPPGSYVMSRNWDTRGASVGGSNPIGPTNSGTIEFTNCQNANNRIRINGVEQAIGSTYTIDPYDTNPDLGLLNTVSAGTKYSRQLTVDGIAPQTATFTVTEAPFAQFKGNDVRVCNDGASNRFVWDNRPTVGSDSRGSYGEYATIFSANNLPDTGYQGLNSYKSPPGPGTRNALETLWSASPCPTFSYAGLSVDSSGNFNEKVGSWYIENDVIPLNTNTITPANQYTVKIFYAKKDSVGNGGNIYIANNVTKINAILIAEGNIYTCARPAGTDVETVPQDRLDEDCNQPLVINGAIMADQVHLMRASGTRFLNNGNNPAEVINYPWQLHHATSPLKTTDINDIDAIIDLPPRL
jgi:hypothetical protein